MVSTIFYGHIDPGLGTLFLPFHQLKRGVTVGTCKNGSSLARV